MTTYETVMVVLTCLTLVVSLMMLVIKLLLIIIDKSEKNTKSKDSRLLAVPFFNYIIVYTKLKVNIPDIENWYLYSTYEVPTTQMGSFIIACKFKNI